MKVKFIGKSFKTNVWKNQMLKRSYNVIKNREFKTGIWGGSESVLTTSNEWICDCDSNCFKEKFEILEK